MKIYNSIDIDDKLKEIVKILDNDGLIIFPTDTVYGLACNSMSEKAIYKLYSIKNRDFNKPIGVLTNSISKINLICKDIGKLEMELMEKYFPGDLTIILKKNDLISDILTANNKTIAVRIPNNEVALKILKSYKYPLATTSVNLSGRKDGCEVKDFIDDFKNKVDIIIDGGKTREIPSTIVKIENNDIIVLREGNLKL